MSVKLYFYYSGMVLIGEDCPGGIIRDPYEVFVTPENGKLTVSMVPAFSLLGLLPRTKKICKSEYYETALVTDPTPEMLEHYTAQRAKESK